MVNWTPIRKIFAAVVGAGLTWVALRLGLSLGSEELNEAATAIVGVIFAYVIPDPRVVGSGSP